MLFVLQRLGQQEQGLQVQRCLQKMLNCCIQQFSQVKRLFSPSRLDMSGKTTCKLCHATHTMRLDVNS